jgi:hypothetical protein
MSELHEPLELPDLPAVTGELLDWLARRYAVPRCCRVCGAPLKVVNSGGMKMACTSDAASPLANPLRSGTWRDALDHYQASVLFSPPRGDPAVLALVAEVRRLREVQVP